MKRLSRIECAIGEPVRRDEHDQPGSLIHVDAKTLGNIADGGGWWFVGRGRVSASGTPPSRVRTSTPSHCLGYAFVHTMIDDHSRLAHVKVHDDETATSASEVLTRAVAWFTARDVTIERVLSHNGSA